MVHNNHHYILILVQRLGQGPQVNGTGHKRHYLHDRDVSV